jgi:hypothetical protein
VSWYCLHSVQCCGRIARSHDVIAAGSAHFDVTSSVLKLPMLQGRLWRCVRYKLAVDRLVLNQNALSSFAYTAVLVSVALSPWQRLGAKGTPRAHSRVRDPSDARRLGHLFRHSISQARWLADACKSRGR